MKKTCFNLFLMLFCLVGFHQATAQERTVTGIVTSLTDKMPMAGVSVSVKGKKQTTATDFAGTFSIKVTGENPILVFKFMGYKTVERTIETASTLNVKMAENNEQLKEIVINTGYQKTSKRTFTGAAAKIDEKDLKIEGVIDVSRMIEGKASGITVQNVTGTFGTAPRITVRGSSSIFSDIKPLWVIDGIVQEDIINVSAKDLASGNAETLLSSSVAGLNASDITSVEILKDASATAIYGSRAKNGVVVVTTKSGKRNMPISINYSLENTMRLVPSYDQYDILNSKENISILNEMYEKGFLQVTNSLQGRNGGVFHLAYKQAQAVDATGDFGVINDRFRRGTNLFLQKYELANTDWFKTLFRQSMTQNHSLSFSGGGENNAFYGSASFYTDPGWTIADRVNRITANVKNTFFINKKLNLGLSMLGSVREQEAPGSFDSQSDSANGTVSRDFDINPFSYALNTSRTLRPYDEKGNLEYYRMNWAPFNIINELQNNKMKIDVKDIQFQGEIDYKISPSLTYNGIASVRYVNTSNEHNIAEESNVVKAYRADNGTTQEIADNVYLYRDPNRPDELGKSILKNGGIQINRLNTLTNFNFRNSFTYKKTIANKHELEGFFGQEIRSVNREAKLSQLFGVQFGNGLVGFTDPRAVENLVNNGGTYYDLSYARERAVAFFSKVGYTYDRRYTGGVTFRYDGSNGQGSTAASRWLPTYTFSGKWNVSQEKFMEKFTKINNLSFRASYGLTANAGLATNSTAINRSGITTRNLTSDRESALFIEELKNKDLTWEKQFETNLGVDLGLFNNSVQITSDVFQRKAFDLVDAIATSGIGGKSFELGNNADMTTKGLEFSIATRNIKTDNFEWSSNFNFTLLKQEITKLQSVPSVLDLVNGRGASVLGKPRNALYSYQFTGLTSEGFPTFVTKEGQADAISGANLDDNQDITQYLKYEGSVEPNKSAGFSNTFTYKNLTFSFLIVASGGNKIRLNPTYASEYDDLTLFTKDFSNRWALPGDEAKTNIPVIASTMQVATARAEGRDLRQAYNAYNYSDQRVADGGFIRMKNISFGYELPKLFKDKFKIKTFNLKLVSVNPFLIYSDKKLNGQDPEFFLSGGVATPITSQYSFVINVSL